jgi:hypothetical protein
MFHSTVFNGSTATIMRSNSMHKHSLMLKPEHLTLDNNTILQLQRALATHLHAFSVTVRVGVGDLQR